MKDEKCRGGTKGVKILMINEQKKAGDRNSVKKRKNTKFGGRKGKKRGREKVKSNSLKTLVTRLGIYVHRDELRVERKLT